MMEQINSSQNDKRFTDSRESQVIILLDEIEQVLAEKGVSIEELIAAGQEIRQELYNEKYG
jgi:hypothetical protein